MYSARSLLNEAWGQSSFTKDNTRRQLPEPYKRLIPARHKQNRQTVDLKQTDLVWPTLDGTQTIDGMKLTKTDQRLLKNFTRVFQPIQTNPAKLTRFTPSTDKHYSLYSEEDNTGWRNVSQRQQFFFITTDLTNNNQQQLLFLPETAGWCFPRRREGYQLSLASWHYTRVDKPCSGSNAHTPWWLDSLHQSLELEEYLRLWFWSSNNCIKKR